MTMLICETCKKKGHRCAPSSDGTCGVYEKKTMTNFERIKSMSVEEMARAIDKFYLNANGDGYNGWDNYYMSEENRIKWLESEIVEWED